MPALPSARTMRSPADSGARIVTEYLTAYLSGEISTASQLVREDFSFRAPLIEAAASKGVFLAGSDRKASYVRAFRILRQWEDGDEVSTLYEIDIQTSEGAASLLMHEWHTLAAGRIASSVMLFDTAAPAARLLYEALSGPEN